MIQPTQSKYTTLATRLGVAIATLVLSLTLTAGFASAQSDHDDGGPANVTQCKEHYRDFGFKNQGQCVSWFNHDHDGDGYGGKPRPPHDFHFPFNFGNFFQSFFHHFGRF